MVIPVYTRNSPCIRHLPFVIVVYPCVYRELASVNNGCGLVSGLSLCIQGTLLMLRLSFALIRFIPVYTGNSEPVLDLDGTQTVYPCVYRELSPKPIRYYFVAGLSLCIQGTPGSINPFRTNHRFIPVYTGNSSGVWSWWWWLAVYPCVYRELCCVKRLNIPILGLSLCIQGTLADMSQNKDSSRFIPVYTGNSLALAIISLYCAVYPCVYRELCWRWFSKSELTGLSLCIQGTLITALKFSKYRRFIPVYTGNSDLFSLRCDTLTVYPCVYRELERIISNLLTNNGLSLCIQGTLIIM